MKILGIETSCDETAAAVVEDGTSILSNVVVSQIDIFAEYGGVIPEVAARSHLEVILPVIDKAMKDASCTWEDIDAIAVTHAPGLLGSLLIGTLTARTLAILHDKPLYAVHHLKSHVYANWLTQDTSKGRSEARVLAEPVFSDAGLEFSSTSYTGRPGEIAPRGNSLGAVRNIRVENSNQNFMHPRKTGSATRTPLFPLLAVVISGGHTQILRMEGHNQFEIVGTTRDDAVGECFDKVAKILGLPYPGGPSIAKAAEGQYVPNLHRPGDSNKYHLPHPKVEGLDFSFSGLKTAVLRAVQKEVGVDISYPSHKLAELLAPQQVADFAALFQKTAIDILIEKLEAALSKHPDTRSVVFAGGVSANKELRARVLAEPIFSDAGLEFTSTSYAGTPGEPPLRGEPLGSVRNIRVENSNHSMHPRKTDSATRALPVYFPTPSLSGDNGAMVGAACFYEIQSGVKPADPYSLNIYPRISVEK